MNDPLLERVDKLNKEIEERALRDRRATSETRVHRMNEDLNRFWRFYYQLLAGFHWIWANIVAPVWRRLSSVLGTVFNWYKRVWSLVVYRRDEFENLRFSKVRAGSFLTVTLLCLYFIWTLIGISWHATMYLLTAKVDEVVYMTNAQEVSPIDDIYSAQGCVNPANVNEKDITCDDDNSLYFRIEPSLFNHVWAVSNSWDWKSIPNVFYPDYVAAAIPPGLNKCVITSYGSRWKFFVRGMDLYPILLKASCKPL